jgi:hypothetical protein
MLTISAAPSCSIPGQNSPDPEDDAAEIFLATDVCYTEPKSYTTRTDDKRGNSYIRQPKEGAPEEELFVQTSGFGVVPLALAVVGKTRLEPE